MARKEATVEERTLIRLLGKGVINVQEIVRAKFVPREVVASATGLGVVDIAAAARPVARGLVPWPTGATGTVWTESQC